MHLLVVEDDERLRRALRRLLEADRHVVELAEDGESAIEIAEATDGIDAVILDIGLPDMSGLDVARRWRPSISRPTAAVTNEAPESAKIPVPRHRSWLPRRS